MLPNHPHTITPNDHQTNLPATSTCGPTTTSDLIEALNFARRGVTAPDLRRHLLRSPPAFSVGIGSAAWFTEYYQAAA